MTFELSARQQTARDRARAFARDRIAPLASAIDEHGRVPADLLRELAAANLLDGAAEAVTLVVVVEELATASGAVAACAALGPSVADGAASAHTGLRGVWLRASDTKGRLVLAGVALGLGRAAIELALVDLKAAFRASQDSDKPHWVVADAATELEAARLLTMQAAQILDGGGDGDGAVAVAKLIAAASAQRAVDSALRVTGPGGYAKGGLLERLARDVRAAGLLMGTEDDQRTIAAAAWFPAQS